MLREGHLGVHPPGALGVAFFVHARADCLVGSSGDGITTNLKELGALRLDESGVVRSTLIKDRIFSNLLEADARHRMPELVLVCCNPDQLANFTHNVTRYLENLHERGRLKSVEDIRAAVPILLILPNGILAEHVSQTYADQINEARLLQRLKHVSDDMVQALMDRVVRGVSLQAGGRRGSGPEAVYILERKGSLVFAGGGEQERARIEAILASHEYPFIHARGVPGTRIEFDKAMISIVLNVGGLIHTVRPDGSLIDLRMGDLCKDESKAEFIERVTRAVFEVGQAVGAYPADADYDDVWAGHRATIMKFAGHVTSSLKLFRDALGRDLSGVKLFSNEEWILTPLSRYAARAGLADKEALFKKLKHQVQESMARAIRHRDASGRQTDSRGAHMKLAAQRNFSIELYDAGHDNMLMIGTMLDEEHLIKLEVNVNLEDEQITRSQLHMIRVPFPVCREVENLCERLVGLRIERGVLGEIVRRIGGRGGCSHIKELATNIVYFAASHLVRRRSGVDPMATDYVTKPPLERFTLTKALLRDSCLAYCQATPQGLDEQIGIKRVGEAHTSPVPLGSYEPSLGLLLKDRAERWGDRVYVRSRTGEDVQTWSWTEFAAQTRQIARHLMAAGIRHGDRIAVLSENRPEMYLFEMAAMCIGAASVPIFAGYPPAQISYVLGHARPRMLVVSGRHQLDKLEQHRHPWVETTYCMDADEKTRAWGAVDFDTLLQEGGAPAEEVERGVALVEPDDLCMVMYTSGTTGSPKGVKLSHRNLISQQRAISQIWDVDEHDVFFSYLPWHHSFGGLFERFMTLYNGCELCLDDSRGRDILRMIDNWKLFDPTLCFSVPRVHEQLVNRAREHSDAAQIIFGGRLRFVFTAGAPLPASVEAAYRERNIPVLEGWGLTETSPCVTVTTRDSSWRSGYVGLPIPGVSVRVDGDQEILVRGPNVMSGYLDDEEATAHVIDNAGWFHTGDLGEFSAEGLRVIGRKDGAFKLTTGEKVHPQRVETVLVNESPFISMALVLGSGKDYVGALLAPECGRLQEWAAQRGLSPDGLLNDPAVAELFASELERINPMIDVKYQRVRRAMLLDREPSLSNAELTPSGKIIRRAILAHHREKVDALFAMRPLPGVIAVETQQVARV